MAIELNAVPEGLIQKYLSWDRNQGEGSRVSRQAFKIYERRLKNKIPGTRDEDWQKAEAVVRRQAIVYDSKLSQN